MAIRTDTSKYEFANGRKPKGFGWWHFDVTGYDFNDTLVAARFDATGTYTDAKKKVRENWKKVLNIAE